MRIYSRGKKRTKWVQWKGRRTSLRTSDPKLAEIRFRELQRADVDPTYLPKNETTLGAALKDFVQFKIERGRAIGTISMYDTHIGYLHRILGENTLLPDIDAEAIDRYVSTRTKEGASKSTRWKEWCTMRGTLKRARKLGKYPYPIELVTPDDMQPEYVPLTRHLLLPDVMRLMAELEPERRAVAAFIVATAADLASVWRAQPEDFKLAPERPAKGRAAELGLIVVRGSKTATRARVVPVLPVFAELAKVAAAGAPFQPWFNCRRDLMRAATRAGVGPMAKDGEGRHITARDLRRSHGRILRAAGVDPALIGPMLGHAPGSPVTARSYAQLEPHELGGLIAARMRPRARAKTGTNPVQGRRAKKRPSKKAAAKRATT